MNAKELKTGFWRESQKKAKPILQYDSVLDTLFMYFSPQETDRIVAHFVDDCVAFLYRSSDKEIIGMKVEYFKAMFLPDAPGNRRAWMLSDTGEELSGIKDLKIVVDAIEKKKAPPMEMIIPYQINQSIEFEPIFA